MREKIKRILDLVRAEKLTLEDAAPLLAALNARLALTESDREFVSALLARGEMDTAQVAEHLLLLRGVRDMPQPPPPPRPPQFSGGWGWDDRHQGRPRRGNLMDDLTGGLDSMVDQITETVERAVEGALPYDRQSQDRQPQDRQARRASSRILSISVESAAGDEYRANLPVSLAPHLHRLIPPHGLQALEGAGFSVEALQLLIEADPPPGDLIRAQDAAGNEVHIALK